MRGCLVAGNRTGIDWTERRPAAKGGDHGDGFGNGGLRRRSRNCTPATDTRAEFHRIYERTPKHFRAELIGEIVYEASPLRIAHGSNHLPLGAVFFAYESGTPGTQSGDNTTILLGDEGEPQPDLYLNILPEHGGQSAHDAGRLRRGRPELIAEIAHSSRAIDLHAKRDDYTRYGVANTSYSVCARRLRWFDLAAGRELDADGDGVYRIRVFPGLWVDGKALLARDFSRLTSTLGQGLATPEHAAFVARLAGRPSP